MSETTFSQPSSATTGLQPYDLDRRVKSFVRDAQGSPVGAGTTRSRLSRHRRSAGTTEDAVMTLVPQMMQTLKKSVVEIALAGGENVEALLTKSFGEFEEAFAPELGKAVVSGAEEIAAEALAKSAEFEEPLYKGLGAVGRIANLLSMTAGSVKRIEDGVDYASSSEDADVPPDHVLMLLHHAIGAIELALRAAVNEHVEPVGDDEEPEDGYNYVHVGNVEDPDDDAGMVVKCALPEALAKMATDPGAISIAAVQAGSALLLEAGVSEAQLSKAFDIAEPGGRLAKAVDPNDPNADPSADPNADPSQDPGAQGPSQDAGGFDLMAQLEILGRINAAGFMQLDHIIQNVQALTGAAPADGGADMGMDPGADPNADAGAVPPGGDDAAQQAPAPGGDGADAGAPPQEQDEPADKPPVKKSVEAEELQKLRDQVATLEKRTDPALVETRAQLTELQGKLAKLSAEPAPFKGVARVMPLSKEADSGGEGDDDLKKMASELDRATTPEAKNQVLLKMAFRYPGADLTQLAKSIGA